eukprot:m.103142 g.103142  ORF g.103142 m.103142 type:complete len:476 (-) comp20860_c0_seq2:102-1529(-)
MRRRWGALGLAVMVACTAVVYKRGASPRLPALTTRLATTETIAAFEDAIGLPLVQHGAVLAQRGPRHPVLCVQCATAVSSLAPLLLQSPEVLRGVSASPEPAPTFWVRDEAMPLDPTPSPDRHQVRNLETNLSTLISQCAATNENETAPWAQYYNGDTTRLPLGLRAQIVGGAHGLFGEALVRAAARGAASDGDTHDDWSTYTGNDSPLSSNLWVSCGSTGLRVQTHYDTVENVLIQLEGTKEVRLAAPGSVGLRALSFLSVHSRHAQPESGPVDWHRVTLSPGDALYVPPGYWHSVQTAPHVLSISVSLFGDSVYDRLADAVSALPFDPHTPTDTARALAVYTHALAVDVFRDAPVATAFVAAFVAQTNATWTGSAPAPSEQRRAMPPVPGCDAGWRASSAAQRESALPPQLALQIRQFVLRTAPLWRDVNDVDFRATQLKAHLETVAFAGAAGEVLSVPAFLHQCVHTVEHGS